MDRSAFFEHLWADYTASTPQAKVIRDAFVERGEEVVNDHVAFRTLALEPMRLERLEPHLLAIGYERYEHYEFPEKKLSAWGYTAPDSPRVFLSELLVDQLSPSAQAILQRCASQVDPDRLESTDALWAGRLWEPVSWDEYQTLRAESEYAAWMTVMGLRTNHFTISINNLSRAFDSVESVLRLVESLGFKANEAGGRTKGSPEKLLEQGSTLADTAAMVFAGGEEHEAPTCYYEFAKRYPGPDGELFQGFVASSASKIFESTDAVS